MYTKGSLHSGICRSADGSANRVDKGTRNRYRSQARRIHDYRPLAWHCRRRLCQLAPWLAAVIRIDAIWLATEPLDMRAGTDTALARVIKVFGAARPHHAYLFANKRTTRLKVLVYDGFGIWLADRRLNKGRFVWINDASGVSIGLNEDQLSALMKGLPWKTLEHGHTIAVV